MKNRPNQEEIDGFEQLCKEMIELKKSKSGDYSNSWRALGLQGLYYQIARKFTRLWVNKDKKDNELNHEMLEDTLTDLAVYSVMAKQLIREKDTKDKIDNILKGIK